MKALTHDEEKFLMEAIINLLKKELDATPEDLFAYSLYHDAVEQARSINDYEGSTENKVTVRTVIEDMVETLDPNWIVDNVIATGDRLFSDHMDWMPGTHEKAPLTQTPPPILVKPGMRVVFLGPEFPHDGSYIRVGTIVTVAPRGTHMGGGVWEGSLEVWKDDGSAHWSPFKQYLYNGRPVAGYKPKLGE